MGVSLLLSFNYKCYKKYPLRTIWNQCAPKLLQTPEWPKNITLLNIICPTFCVCFLSTHFTHFLRLPLCPLPPSPPFLCVQGGLWLPCTKNSFCHLRSAHAILHRCHNTDTRALTSAERCTLWLLKGKDSTDSVKYFVHWLHFTNTETIPTPCRFETMRWAQEMRSGQMMMINSRLNDSLIMNTSSLQCLESARGGESDTE